MSNLLIISATNDNNLELSNKLHSKLYELNQESKVISLENFDFPLFGGKTDVDETTINDLVKELGVHNFNKGIQWRRSPCTL